MSFTCFSHNPSKKTASVFVFPKKIDQLSTLRPYFVSIGRFSAGSHGTGHFVHGQCGTQYERVPILSLYPRPPVGREGFDGPGFVTGRDLLGGVWMVWRTLKGGEVYLAEFVKV